MRQAISAVLLIGILAAGRVAAATTRPGTGVPTSQAAPDPEAEKVAKTKNAARRQAQTAMDALMADRYDAFVAALDPVVVEQMGGRAKMISMLGDGKKKMKEKGISLDGASAGAVETVAISNGTAYAIVPEKLDFTFPAAKGSQISFLLGVSTDGGGKWTFVDGAVGEKELRRMFPGITKQFAFPAPSQMREAKSQP